ncbi:MAG: hypothetical protein ACPGJS_07280 [Flammeovirgaceae bacterium]
MNKRIKFSFVCGLLVLLFGTVWYMNERDAQLQLEQLLAERQASYEKVIDPEATPSGYLFAPESRAHQNLMRWGFDAQFKTVALNYQEGLWYLHQSWTDWPLKRSTLSAYVSEKGELSLVSHYLGDQILAHNQVLVRIGNVVYDSTFVPNYTKELLQSIPEDQQIQEMNNYTSPQDQEIIRHIASAGNEEVNVLIKGKTASHSFTLSSADKQAISDCYRLAQRILQG